MAQNKLEKIPLPNAAVAAAAAAAPAQSTSLTAPRYDCPLLEELYLQDNRLEEVPAAIFDMDALITLDVSNNKLQKLPYGMWNAPKLRDLNVAFNLLKDLPYFSSVNMKFCDAKTVIFKNIKIFCRNNNWHRYRMM